MLKDNNALATIAVRDMKRATDFYEGKLGFTRPAGEEPQVTTYMSGNSTFLVYLSQFAGTNQATSITWAVDDVDSTVSDLKEKGVTFERYDFAGITHDGDVHVMGKRRNAWFKDPDGNILAIVGA
jgi:catechol 2,3-dioxygenase-like lactoylglutathione lyase family enzyme